MSANRQWRTLTEALLQPNPFNLLKQNALVCRLLDGSWNSMPEKRRAAFVGSLPPNFHEWDAVMDEEATVDVWRALTARTLLVSDAGTRRPIREIAEIFAKACPHWTFRTITGGDIWPR